MVARSALERWRLPESVRPIVLSCRVRGVSNSQTQMNVIKWFLLLSVLLPWGIALGQSKEAASSRSEFTLRSNAAGGGIIFANKKTLAVAISKERVPRLIVPANFPYGVSFDPTERKDCAALIVIMRSYSREEKSQLVDCVEVTSSGELRFASDETMKRLLGVEAQGKAQLREVEETLSEAAKGRETTPEKTNP